MRIMYDKFRGIEQQTGAEYAASTVASLIGIYGQDDVPSLVSGSVWSSSQEGLCNKAKVLYEQYSGIQEELNTVSLQALVVSEFISLEGVLSLIHI